MESSPTLHEAQAESGNLIQPHDHQIEIMEQQKNHEEETKEKVEKEIEIITFMEYDVYEAAERGETEPAIEQRKDRLHSLLTPQKNTILHIYLTSKTSKDSEPDEFVADILGFCPPLLMQVNSKEETPLHIAARYGHASIVKQLIKYAKQDHPHHHNQDHESRDAEAAKKMLRMASKEGDTALHEAVRFQHLHVVKILISEDGDFNHNANNSGETPLYMAVERGYNLIAKEIIEHCSSPATGGPTGRNALHAATIRKDKVMVNEILKKFGEEMLKQADLDGWTPLHYAAHMGNINAVKTFLGKGMSREAAYMKNRDGNTALHLATVSDNKEIVLEIIKQCPDSGELVNKRGRNFLHLAARNRFSNLLKDDVLQSRRSLSNLINEKDAEGNTPLHHISISINYDYRLNLIDHPTVDKLAFNSENKNALDLASTTTVFGLWKDSKRDNEVERNIEEMKKVEDANVIVAALISTVTFAAGFSIPGGFVSEIGPLEGTPVLGRNSAFKTFMVMDTVAMVLSTTSVFIHLYIKLSQKVGYVSDYTMWSLLLTISAMLAMLVAFATGTYAMLAHSIALSIVILHHWNFTVMMQIMQGHVQSIHHVQCFSIRFHFLAPNPGLKASIPEILINQSQKVQVLEVYAGAGLISLPRFRCLKFI
ncbi:hypothetical protein FNV43_RR01528 [Rhamnella rubrinervis]|uniref:PGG domain-containing protein n=1 Tax=Rhamnella rubrinervis TaxID=2594499 RepID=A0A8K0MSY2_9ROSA|nr:hypothetical protein FNV43_RR01528 [Rhamnella rubrinervis]